MNEDHSSNAGACRVNTYAEYLKSEHWERLKGQCFNKYGKRCRICGCKQWIDVHHLRYRDRWEDSQPQDLMPLCRDCHERVHREVPMPHSAMGLISRYKNTVPFSKLPLLTQVAILREKINRREQDSP